MKFVLKWSYACAKSLANALNENHNRRAVYYYGFYILFGSVVKASILLSVSFLLGVIIPTIIISLVFGSLRAFAGGYHFDTYGRCLFISLGLFLTTGVISQYTYNYWNALALSILLVVSFAATLPAIIKFAPRDTPTKPITDPAAIKNYKKLSIIYLAAWFTVSGTLIFLHLNLVVLASVFGILLEVFSITPQGHTFFNLIKSRLNVKVKHNTI